MTLEEWGGEEGGKKGKKEGGKKGRGKVEKGKGTKPEKMGNSAQSNVCVCMYLIQPI